MNNYLTLFVTAAVVLAIGGRRVPAQEAMPQPVAVYDSDPQHLWNRLHEILWHRVAPDERVYGHDRVDPLLWSQTRHLLQGPSRKAVRQVLRDFLDNHGEKLIDDPLKRALLQRDLWAIFDWLANRHTDENYEPIGAEAQVLLRRPLALAIERLALDPQSIEKLPDTYAAAVASRQFASKYDPAQPQASFLPPDLFDPHGPWVCVGRNGSDIVVPAHASGFSRSVFQVFLKLPDGRQATSDYLTALSSFKQPFVFQPLANDGRVRRPNPELPEFPAGTQVALVRSALLIDSGLRPRATRIVESVQLRDETGNYEFTLSRALLFAGTAGGLRAVALEERDFDSAFNGTRIDVFEDGNFAGKDFARRMQVVRKTCVACHRHGTSVQSFNTFVGGFSPPELNPSFYDTRTTARGETAAIRHKQTLYDWGLLEGLVSAEHESAAKRP